MCVTVLDPECPRDARLNATVGGELNSPGYPDDYESWSQCVWTIESEEDSTIELLFFEFLTEEYNDFVTVTSLVSSCPRSPPSLHML